MPLCTCTTTFKPSPKIYSIKWGENSPKFPVPILQCTCNIQSTLAPVAITQSGLWQSLFLGVIDLSNSSSSLGIHLGGRLDFKQNQMSRPKIRPQKIFRDLKQFAALTLINPSTFDGIVRQKTRSYNRQDTSRIIQDGIYTTIIHFSHLRIQTKQ